jgi:uncharacterized membrane protein YkvA (DUF1232 family)
LYRFGLLAHRFARTFEPRQFGDALREEISHYNGPHAEHIIHLPHLFDMFTNLLEDGSVHPKARGIICQALAYFVTPFDLLPEEIYGVEGYIDQVYLSLYILNKLQDELPAHVLQRAWQGEGEFEGLILQMLPEIEKSFSEEDKQKIKKYVGI